MIRGSQAANRYMKRCSSLIVMEIQIKTTMKYDIMTVRKAIIKRQEIVSSKQDLDRGKSLYTTDRNALQKTKNRFLEILRKELSYNPDMPLPGICMKNKKTLIQREICTPILTAVLFSIAEIKKHPKCAIGQISV